MKGKVELKLLSDLFGYFFQEVTTKRTSTTSSLTDNWFNSHANEAVEQIKSDLISINKLDKFTNTSSILDFGCGDGIMLGSLSNKLNVIGHGVDFTLVDKKVLKDIFLSNNSEINIESLSFFTLDEFDLESSYDLVLSWSVIEHVSSLDNYFEQILKLLKPNGILYLQTWPLWNSSQGHHVFDVGLNAFEHIEFSSDEKFFTHLNSIKDKKVSEPQVEIDFNNWKNVAIDSYNSCNRITIDEIQTCIENHPFKLLFLKPYFEDVNFSLVPSGGSWKDFAISGGRWILQRR